jgi:tetratricopeptide (TPR) repeat protein
MNRRERRAAGQKPQTLSRGSGVDTPAVLHATGMAHLRAGRRLDAQTCCQKALAIDPSHADTLHLMGLLSLEAGQADHAGEWISRAIEQYPKPEYLASLAVALHRLNRLDEALATSQKAYALNPNNAATCNNIGATLQLLGRDREALKWFDRAHALRPDHVVGVINKASSLQQLHRFDEAIAAYRQAKVIDPANPEPDWNLALINLLRGDFEAGWAGREARWRRRINPGLYPKFSEPRWFGDGNIDGKTILICADEGLGDTIQFARYVPMIAQRGARVILVVEPPAYPLLRGLPGIAQCLPKAAGTQVPDFDLHCPMSALPLVFKTRLDSIPSGVSYLPPLQEARVQAWQQRLDDRIGASEKLRIGLVWSGNPTHPNDHNRSLPMHTLARILDVDATFISLQKDLRPDDQAALRERADIVDLTAALTDLSETAALVSCLDLVITIDSGVAHLAAALGCPTWILLPYTPDYRWLLDRDDSPWYPTVRLFRQTETRDYAEVLDRVRRELQALIAANKQHQPIDLAAAQPVTPDLLHAAGLRQMQDGHYDQAVESMARAIRQDAKPEYLASLGTALRRQGRHEDALKAFDKAAQLKPGDAGLWHNLGDVLIALKRYAEALLSFQHVLKLDPRHSDAACRCGVLLHQQGRQEEALAYLDLGAELQPNQAVMHEMRAVVLHSLYRYEQALAANRRAHALNPGNAETCNNIGAALQFLGGDEEALLWFDRALELRPDFFAALNNKAASLQQVHRFDDALAAYYRMRAIDPENAELHQNLSLLHLLLGNFEGGWAGREARLKVAGVYPKFSQPRWTGAENIGGKTILICADEGLGDTIQFVRYVPMLTARGARVILLVDGPTQPLLSGLSGVSQCIAKSASASLPAFDMHCPICSLPLAFGTRLDTIPSFTSYLPAPAEKRVQAWEARLQETTACPDRLRVGLVWSGNPAHKNDCNRSTSLHALSRILDVDATFVSLQKDPRPNDQATLREHPGIVDLTAHLSDLGETAALVSRLDLVISVDTSVAHLAAALGRPTWLMLAYRPDFRWLLDREDSPWYPTMRLFRQTKSRDYAEMAVRIRAEIMALIAERQAPGRR